MNQIVYKIFFGLFLMLLSRAVFGQVEYNDIDWGVHPMEYSSVGTVGWQFLKLPTNARHAAMGGVNSSVSHGDAASALTNPASITDVQNVDFSFGHMKWVADINYQSFAAVKNFQEWGAFGISMIYVDYGTEMRTEYQEELSGTVAEYSPVLDGLGTFSAYDMAVGISYARQITNKLQVGGNVKYMREQIDDAKTSVWSLDIGTVFYTGFKSLRISMLGKHFGPDAEFRQYSNRIEKVPFRMKMPMQLSLGAAMDLLQTSSENASRLTIAFEYVVPNDGYKKVNLGSEYVFIDMFALRAGYRFNYDEQGLTFGGGLKYGIRGMKLDVDYAYLDVGLFKQVHLFTVGVHL